MTTKRKPKAAPGLEEITPRDLPKLLTSVEVCAQFHSIERHFLLRLARRGEIPCVRIGRQYRFPCEALQTWVASGGVHRGSGR